MEFNTGLSADQSDSRSVEERLQLPPGFRFHPTDYELVEYLRKKSNSETFQVNVIAEVDLYKFNPWDLPRMALVGEKEWYFFSPRDRKYPRGARPNRAAKSGFWKATGPDKPISRLQGDPRRVGMRKSLVFYEGRPGVRAPKPVKTNWIMHEYRLHEGVASSAHHHSHGSMRLDDWVLCRIYKKPTRVGDEHDISESMPGSLPEIDDLGLHHSFEGESSAAQEALMEGMLADCNPSEDGPSLMTTLPMRTTSHNSAGIWNLQASSPAFSNEWAFQDQAMASTSHGHNVDKARFLEELAATQALIMPSTAGQFRQFPNKPSHNSYMDLHMEQFNSMMPTGRSPISDEESQSSFQSVYGFDSMYPALGYDHHPTPSYATPGLTENSVHPPPRFPNPPGNTNPTDGHFH